MGPHALVYNTTTDFFCLHSERRGAVVSEQPPQFSGLGFVQGMVLWLQKVNPMLR